ncbi:MAG: 2-amino-4-hydroxy-6-hydroxymethyldihydropteridine diphosphokinase [Candidatus Neomarinimicrobiota bacterium]|nr:MAG: 2-amino-4-hydroxy-6-hydroxymethyldihydropteridine diphosphokinase [Candidatus Neomarinimicrobiota bacterium]
MSNPVYFGLGSNLGDREENLASAITALGTHPEIHDLVSASFYQTQPVGNPDQPDFINTVIRYEVDCDPVQLLDITQRTETMLGRPRDHQSDAPRTIDIDILVFDDLIISTAELKIPHPRMAARRFVLVPLAEIAPDLVVPGWNQTVTDLLRLCPDKSRVVKYHLMKNA